MSGLFKWLLRLVVGAVILAALGYVGGRLFLFDIAQVEGTGMLPTVGPGAYVMSWKRAEPARGDIVLFVRDDQFRARRVVALPGETVTYDGFDVIVDGNRARYEERYKIEVGGRAARVMRESLGGESYNVVDIAGRRMTGKDEVKVEAGYYVLSDNREVGVAGDSRQLGEIRRDEIRGVVRWILDPGERPEPVVDEPLDGSKKSAKKRKKPDREKSRRKPRDGDASGDPGASKAAN